MPHSERRNVRDSSYSDGDGAIFLQSLNPCLTASVNMLHKNCPAIKAKTVAASSYL
jgi:hypothetical protein